MIIRTTLALALLLSQNAWSADIARQTTITCISGESNSIGRRTETVEDSNTRIADWIMKENFGDAKSKVIFFWTPKSEKGPKIALETTDKPHNMISIRSRTESSLIVVSSASNFYSAESWIFVINFNVEAMIASRVVSNTAGVGSESIAYGCQFEPSA